MGSESAAREARYIFNKILDISFEEFDQKVGLEKARILRYKSGNIEKELAELLER